MREYTALPGTPVNRRKLERLLERVETDIAAGGFDRDQVGGVRLVNAASPR